MNVKIEKLDYEGRGIVHIDGLVTFIPHALPNEEGIIEISKKEKHYQIGKWVKITKKSPKRIGSFCPYSSYCGGCAYSFVSYQDSLEFKTKMVKELLERQKLSYQNFASCPSRPILGYRNKVSLKVENHTFGYYEEETHHFIPIQKCMLLHPKINELLADFSFFAFEKGTLMIRINEKEELFLQIETKETVKIQEKLVLKHKIKGIVLNGKCVYGSYYLTMNQNGFSYFVSPKSFFQVNPYISKELVKEVLQIIQKEDIVFDLYCGCGFFTFPISLKASFVIGIEEVASSILGAEKIKQEKKLQNVRFHVGKVEKILEQIPEKPTFILVDPPRSGLKKKVIEEIIKRKPNHLLYISCNPKTLVRDLKEFSDFYQIQMVKCFDMFCYTKHIECMCLLTYK